MINSINYYYIISSHTLKKTDNTMNKRFEETSDIKKCSVFFLYKQN